MGAAEVIDFAQKKQEILQTGGKPPVIDWLSTMKAGTEFLTNTIQNPHIVCQEWTHGGLHAGGTVMLFTTDQLGNEHLNFYDPIPFCGTFEFKGYLKEPVENRSEEDGNHPD